MSITREQRTWDVSINKNRELNESFRFAIPALKKLALVGLCVVPVILSIQNNYLFLEHLLITEAIIVMSLLAKQK